MTTGTAFLSSHASSPFTSWEADAVKEGPVPWPLFPVSFTDGTHTLVIQVAGDYVSIGEPGDYVRLPLTPTSAQRIANAAGMVLPTPQMVRAIHQAAEFKLTPHPMVPNKGANLAQYAEHDKAIDDELDALGNGASPMRGIVSGHKKDVVVGNLYQLGKVLIFGWFQPNGQNIQPYSNVHGDFYVDYSHGIRLVSPAATLDGMPVNLVSVMQDKELSKLVSNEGPVRVPRYPAPGSVPAPLPQVPLTPRGADLGLEIARKRAIEQSLSKGS